MGNLRDARKAESLEIDQLFTDTEKSGIDPADCPDCDGTLVPNGPITPGQDDRGRVRRHCSRCDRTVEQGWELDRVLVAGTDDDRSFGGELSDCPDCGASLESVGNFFDHHDGSGRQQWSCTECAVEVDEWWDFQGST